MSLVLWSGGCDSTLVLYHLIQEYMHLGTAQKNEINRPRALSVVHPQITNSRDQYGPRARARIRAWLKAKKLEPYYDALEVKIEQCEQAKVEGGGKEGGLTQPGIWLSMAVNYLRLGEDLYFGYCKGDDFWHYQGWFVQAFNNLQGIRRGTGLVKFPLEHETKVAIVQSLSQVGLFKLCWTCECPTAKGKPCGECHPCETQWLAQQLIKRRREQLDKKYGKKKFQGTLLGPSRK